MTTIRTEDGLELAVLWDDSTAPAVATAVLCHPHPLDGGTMRAPLIRSVAATLARSGIHVLRFDFRGVGESEGGWGGGIDEVRDVTAAVDAAREAFTALPLGIAGWSFGATTSLHWQAETGSTIPWVGIAPGIRPYRGSTIPEFDRLRSAPRLVIAGDRDQFADISRMRAFAESIGAELEELAGSDHFFVFRDQTVGALVAEFLLATAISGE